MRSTLEITVRILHIVVRSEPTISRTFNLIMILIKTSIESAYELAIAPLRFKKSRDEGNVKIDRDCFVMISNLSFEYNRTLNIRVHDIILRVCDFYDDR